MKRPAHYLNRCAGSAANNGSVEFKEPGSRGSGINATSLRKCHGCRMSEIVSRELRNSTARVLSRVQSGLAWAAPAPWVRSHAVPGRCGAEMFAEVPTTGPGVRAIPR